MQEDFSRSVSHVEIVFYEWGEYLEAFKAKDRVCRSAGLEQVNGDPDNLPRGF